MQEAPAQPTFRGNSPFAQPPFPPATRPLSDPYTDPLAHPGTYTPHDLPAVNAHHRASQSPFAAPSENNNEAGASQSLIAALQSTMMAPTTSSRKPIVIPGVPDGKPMMVVPGTRKSDKPALIIPGARKRGRTTDAIRPVRHMSMRLRWIIIAVALLIILLIALLSLSPLNQGKGPFQLLGGVIQWAQSQPLNWTTGGHDAQTHNEPDPVIPLPPVTLPTSQYVDIARQAAIAAGISPDYFVRQINAESGFNPNAISPAGAVGIAQFIPSTAAGLGINPYDPVQALYGAARYMAQFASMYNGSYAKALAAYNAGPGTVNYAVNIGGVYWMNYIPAETRNYIRTIMGI